MQINFTAKKLKEANAYVNLLNPPKVATKIEVSKEESFFKKLWKLLFK